MSLYGLLSENYGIQLGVEELVIDVSTAREDEAKLDPPMALAANIGEGMVAKVVWRAFPDDSLGNGDEGALSAQPVDEALVHEILNGSADGNTAHRIALAEFELGRDLLSHAELAGDDLLAEIALHL